MKKKSPRGIPDFASKRTASKVPQQNEPSKAVHPQAPRVAPKPQATSSKSGRRGT
jgi:hypothetical protein